MNQGKERSRILETTKKIAELIMDHFSKAWEAKSQGKPICWITVFTPVELLYAMDVYPISPEHFGAMCSARRMILGFLEEAERKGYSQNLCSYSRCGLGYAISGMNGIMPPPDILLTFRNSCDVYVKWWQSLHMHLGTPLFIGEAPYVLDYEDLDNYVLDYVAKQLEQLITFLEEKFSLKFNMEKFVKTVELSDKASQLWLEVLKLRRVRPCPLGGRDSASDIFPLVVLQGTEEAVKFYDDLLKEVKGMVAKKEGIIKEEKFRLLFDGIWLWYAFDLIKYFEDRKAVFVYEPYSEAWACKLDPSKPMESMAKKILSMGLNVDIDIRIQRFLDSIKDYQIDGAVLFSNRSCKSWAAPQLVTAETLREKFNVPYLIFEADMADPRQYSEAQVKNRVDAFIEILEEHKCM